jgi:hypothetical protein
MDERKTGDTVSSCGSNVKSDGAIIPDENQEDCNNRKSTHDS